jgi:hypothetical protein
MTSVAWPGNQDARLESSGTWQRLSLILPTWTERMDSPWVRTFPSHRITTKHETGVYLHTGMKQIYLTLWPLYQSLWEKKVRSMKLKHGLIHRPILIFYFPQTLNLNRMDNCYYYGTFKIPWLTPEWYAKFCIIRSMNAEVQMAKQQFNYICYFLHQNKTVYRKRKTPIFKEEICIL